MIRKSLFMVLLAVLMLNACNAQTTWPTKDWELSTPEEQGMDSKLLIKMYEAAKNKPINSILIVRNGKLVFETYFSNYDRFILHKIFSSSKSVTSILVGIAINEGYIKNVNQPISDFFPEIKDIPVKNQITIYHLLTMTSGFNFAGYNILNDKSLKLTKHCLELPMESQPGDRFNYRGENTYLVSAIIQKTTGRTAFEYATEKLFKPLGITQAFWEASAERISFGCTGLYFTPRDMAKIGYLYLNNGVWEDRQIVPAQWVEESTKGHSQGRIGVGNNENLAIPIQKYGYYWWLNSFGGYSAQGKGGQFIFILPASKMIIVFTGEFNDNEGLGAIFSINLIGKYIIPSIAK